MKDKSNNTQPPQSQVVGWQDIATVPTDERLIIIGSYNAKGEWCSEVWSTRYLRDQFAKSADGFFMSAPHLEWLPTHWVELPTPPATKGSPDDLQKIERVRRQNRKDALEAKLRHDEAVVWNTYLGDYVIVDVPPRGEQPNFYAEDGSAEVEG